MLTIRASQVLAISAVAFAAATADAAQTHWYQFQGSLADSQGGPALVSQGGTLGPGNYSFGPNEGLTLTGAVPADVYTLDVTFSFGPKTSWSKIADFSHGTLDGGWYRFNNHLEICGCGGGVQSDGEVFVDNQSIRVTLTRDSSNLVSQYVNGSFAGSYLDSLGAFAVRQPENQVQFFIDDAATGRAEAASGQVSRIVIFDNALNASEVATLAPVPEPEAFALLLAGLTVVGWAGRRQRLDRRT